MAIDLNTAWKKYPCKLLPNGNVLTCPVRLSFVNVFQPAKPMAGQTEGKYGVTLLFPVGADIGALEAAAKQAALDKFGAGYKGPKLHMPFRDQGDKQHLPGYVPGGVFISAQSKQQPGVLNARKEPIVDPAQVYSGMWAIVTLRAFAFDQQAKKGVSFGLQNLMKVADGERFAGKPNPTADFADVDVGDAFAGVGEEKSLADMLA